MKVWDEKAGAIVYYAWSTFGQRRDYTDKLVKLALADPSLKHLLKSWSGIIEDIREPLTFRNDLAHEPIRQQRSIFVSFKSSPEETAKAKAEAEAKGYKFGPYHEVYTAPKKVLKGAQPKSLRIDALKDHLTKVQAIKAALENLAREINKTVSEITREQPPNQ